MAQKSPNFFVYHQNGRSQKYKVQALKRLLLLPTILSAWGPLISIRFPRGSQAHVRGRRSRRGRGLIDLKNGGDFRRIGSGEPKDSTC